MKPPLAVVIALCFGVACGPESFDRSRLQEAGADAQVDAGADPGTDAGVDLEPVEDAPPDDVVADAEEADGSTEDAGGDADADADAATDVRDGGTTIDAGCQTGFGGDLLHSFDTGASVFTGPAPDPAGSLPPNWFAYAESTGSTGLRQSTTEWSNTEGRSCPGALALTANFTVYGGAEKVMALINFNANWAVPKAYARMHAWVKVAGPTTGTLDHLDGVQLATNTNNFMSFRGMTLPNTTFADNGWHEIVLDLTPGGNYVPADVRQIGLQIIARGSAPVSPSAPVPTTVFLDDIWLEL